MVALLRRMQVGVVVVEAALSGNGDVWWGDDWKGELKWWVLSEIEIKSDVCLKQVGWLSLVMRENCNE